MQKFEPFQKVLVRESVDEVWEADFYSHYNEGDHYTITHTPMNDDEVLSQFLIPYNDETKHLLGTTDSPTPKWEPKPGELVAVRDSENEEWKARVFLRRDSDNGIFECGSEMGLAITTRWKLCDPLRKHFTIQDE